MILHAASIAALFIDQLAQAPVVAQCTQNSGQDPLWARLFLAALPSVFALLVAWMVFRWNRKSDQRRWVLDNKKAEWQELLTFASAIEHFMPSVAIGSELTETVHDPLFRQHLRDMTRAVLKCTFIPATQAGTIYEILLKVQMTNEETKGNIEDFRSDANAASRRGIPTPVQSAKKVQSELILLWREVRRFASEDLELEQRNQWRKSLVSFYRKIRRPQVQTDTNNDTSVDTA